MSDEQIVLAIINIFGCDRDGLVTAIKRVIKEEIVREIMERR